MQTGIPVLATVNPAKVTQGQVLTITVTGRFTHFAQGTQLSSGAGVAITNVVVNSPTSLTAKMSIASDAPLGTQALTATTGTEVVALNNAFTIIAKNPQTIVFGVLPNKTYGDSPFALLATGGASTQPVVFTASGTCTVSGNIVTITGAGTWTVTASQAGDAYNNPAQAVTQSFTINRAAASVAPSDAAKTYGSGDPILTGTLSGFLRSDNVRPIFARTAGEAAGIYTISAVVGPASVLTNYAISYNSANFVIAPKPASITDRKSTRLNS